MIPYIDQQIKKRGRGESLKSKCKKVKEQSLNCPGRTKAAEEEEVPVDRDAEERDAPRKYFGKLSNHDPPRNTRLFP
jgi:hypothetical protein